MLEQDNQRQTAALLKRHFRCRECGHRFVARDSFLLQLGVLGAVGAVAITAALVLIYTYKPYQSMLADSAERLTPEPLLHHESPHPERPTSAHRGDMELAAVAGDAQAQYQLGLAMMSQAWQHGESFKLVDGVQWIRTAAGNGHDRAQALLGRCYEQGRGVIQNYSQAAEWYERAAAAGNPVAMGRLGEMLADGRGVDTDIVAAYQWLNLAAARGFVDAERTRNRLQARLSDAELLLAQEASQRLDERLPHLAVESFDWPTGF
jgi:TPR repeat protein